MPVPVPGSYTRIARPPADEFRGAARSIQVTELHTLEEADMTADGFTTCLWFDDQAEEAAHFYVSLFKNSRIDSVSHYGEEAPRPAGTVMTVEFTANGQKFVALNGGPEFTFNEAVSFQIFCDDQEEVDYYWNRLTEGGGAPGPCGWLKDKYGLSWQVVPSRLMEMIGSPDAEKAGRATKAMLSMGKLDIAELEKAYAGLQQDRRATRAQGD
jgi:predicted 3-demethylubiquinone-9 3-methyltransferase (glyoxalase superfamily)